MSSASTTVEEREKGSRVFEETDALDTAQIIDELKGKMSDEYFYTIVDEGGKEQAGLSYAGTKWIASQMAVGENPHALSVLHVDVVDSPDGQTFRAIATVEDTATGERRPGVYEQNKYRRRNVWGEKHKKIGEEEVMVEMYRDGKPIGKVPARDPFAYTIAASKAARNGMRSFMPEPVILKLYQQWKTNKGKAGSPKDITGEAQVRDIPAEKPAGGKTLEEAQYALRVYDVTVKEEDKRFLVALGPKVTTNELEEMKQIVQKMGGKYLMKAEGGPGFSIPKEAPAGAA
jgi:hypothetical protein